MQQPSRPLTRPNPVAPPERKPLSPEEAVAAFYARGETPTVDTLKQKYIDGEISEMEFETAVEQALEAHGLDTASPSTDNETEQNGLWWATTISLTVAAIGVAVALLLHTFDLSFGGAVLILSAVSWAIGAIASVTQPATSPHRL